MQPPSETNERKICRRCVMPESPPEIRLDETGLCSLCVEHDRDRAAAPAEAKPLETNFIKIMNQHKGKGEYDCLVMCSGGKDSTAALYYMKQRYKLKPLAFMFDHGFETEEAIENVKNAVEILGVDFLFFKTDHMREMFAEILKTDSRAVLCHPCSIWYMELSFRMAERFNIPVIIAGWTKGQSTKQPLMSKCGCNSNQPEFAAMSAATKEFLDSYLARTEKYRDFPKSMEEVQARANKRHKCLVLSPHWFLPFGADVYVETIKKELKWKYPHLSYPAQSTNCALNFVSVHNSMRHYGYTHYHVEMSKMIREGLMTREEALENLKITFDTQFLNSITEKLGHTFKS